MKLKCLFLLLLLGISFCVHAQKRPVILEKQLEIIRKEPDNGDALKFLCQYYLNKGDYSKTITYAEIMKNVADKTKNPLLQLYSYIYQAQAQMMSGREKIAKKNLNLSLELATKLNNDSTLCSVYGSLGLYSANIETDYYRAIRWLYKGIQLAQQNNFQQQYYHIIYCQRDCRYGLGRRNHFPASMFRLHGYISLLPHSVSLKNTYRQNLLHRNK